MKKIVLSFFIIGSFGMPFYAHAIPFGGIMTTPPLPCTCTPGLFIIGLIPIGKSSPLSVAYIPGVSMLYQFGILRPGGYLLGDYYPAPTLCTIITPAGCIPMPGVVPVAPLINFTGTSM